MQRIGWANLPGITHLADKIVAPVSTDANGRSAAATGDINPQSWGTFRTRTSCQQARQPAHTAPPKCFQQEVAVFVVRSLSKASSLKPLAYMGTAKSIRKHIARYVLII